MTSTDITENQDNETQDESRRDFLVLTAGAACAVGAASLVWPLVDSMNPSAEVLSLSSIEVDLSTIKEGEEKTVMWRGKPIFIRHRTDSDVTAANKVELKELLDPQKDSERVKSGHEKWLVMIGVCTHLGCVPLGKKGDYNGWFCPCHGSQYDTSGRVRKGPAPQNMHIPPYEFLSDTKIKIG